MTPQLRAILDRFILDTANTKFVAFNLPADALDRPVPGLDRTVLQLFGHIADSLEWAADTLGSLVAGTLAAESWEMEERSPVHAASIPGNPLPALLGRIDAALNALVRTAAAVPPGLLETGLAGAKRPIEALDDWSRHLAKHGIDFADALPELRFDPMMLNWLLYADFDDDPDRCARQRQLLVDLREKYPDDGDDEDG